ncbi:MAG: ABC transporter permease subunit [Acidobacteria bacterium]|nr:ABC transporter permease subunit [Acidobacteriota bacterium]
MRNIFALWKKELSLFFVSPIAYVVLTIFLLLTGFFFRSIVVRVVEFSIQEMIQAQQFGGPPPARDYAQDVLRAFFGVLSTMILFLMPMLTMGVFADEKRRGTIELLLTSPVTHWQIILGKFLASVTFYMVMLLPTGVYALFAYRYSEPKFMWRPVLSGYLGILLLGTVLISIGIFISSLTENQIIAAVTTFAVFIILWVIDFAAQGTGVISEAMQYLSVLNHYDDFAKGVIDTKSLVFYGSLILLGLFLTSTSVESLRWRE